MKRWLDTEVIWKLCCHKPLGGCIRILTYVRIKLNEEKRI